MKILAIIKRVEDPEIKIKVKADGSGIETDQMKYVVNPFDEIAVEEALRVRDTNSGEVVVACVGPTEATQQLRTTLAMGADRAVHIVTNDRLDPTIQAAALQKVLETEEPDLVILGKQAVDDDMGQLGIMLAERMGWGQATFASKEDSLDSDAEKQKKPALAVSDGAVLVMREIDHGLETLSLKLPCIVTTELRLNVPRYASLPGIMKAKKKPIDTRELTELVGTAIPAVRVMSMESPPSRQAGIQVPDVSTLVDKLRNEAKVL